MIRNRTSIVASRLGDWPGGSGEGPAIYGDGTMTWSQYQQWQQNTLAANAAAQQAAVQQFNAQYGTQFSAPAQPVFAPLPAPPQQQAPATQSAAQPATQTTTPIGTADPPHATSGGTEIVFVPAPAHESPWLRYALLGAAGLGLFWIFGGHK
jgi:hypothetical protein